MKQGFTLIEILIVLVIMAVLVGTAVVSVGAGMKSARLRDAARAVQLYTRHAKAVALLKQRPVVITFEEILDGGEFQKSRISIAFSGDAEATGTTVFGAGGDGLTRNLLGEVVGEDAEPEVAPSADAGGETSDPLMAEPREFEGIHVRGSLRDEETERRPRISVFSNVDVLLKKSSDEQAKKKEKQLENGTKSAADDETEEDRVDEETKFSVVYEVNGRCDPYTVKVFKDGQDEDGGLVVNIGRFGRPVTGE